MENNQPIASLPAGKTILSKEFKDCTQSKNRYKRSRIANLFCRIKARIDKEIIKKIVKSIFIFLLVAGFLIVLPRLPFLKVQLIEVENVANNDFVNISKEQIISSIQEAKQENYFSLSTREYEQKILESDTKVKAVYIEKVFPNKITVTIEERIPILSVYSRGSCALIADDSFVLSVLEGDCTEQIGRYLTDYAEVVDNKAKFETGSKNNSYLIAGLMTIRSKADKYGFSIERVLIKDTIAYIILRGDVVLNLVVDFDKSVEEQMARFSVIMDYTPTVVRQYSSIDLRFEKPVLLE